MDQAKRKINRFTRMAWVTLLAVLFLIWVGAMVRATGSGMGCPDWPTCFGQWVPPTDVSQLPANYKEIYADHGYAANDFDPRKTWIEYLNRLTGTSIGLLIFITLILAFQVRQQRRLVFRMTLAAFVAVGLNGWLGSVVVKTNLHPAVITTHMLLSFAVIAALIVALCDSTRERLYLKNSSQLLRYSAGLAVLVTLIQVALGAQVREGVDAIAAVSGDFNNRDGWVAQLGATLNWHRGFAIIVFLVNITVFWQLRQHSQLPRLIARVSWVLLTVLLVIVTLGGIMVVFSIPKMAQPLHLFFVVLLFSAQMVTLCSLYLNDEW